MYLVYAHTSFSKIILLVLPLCCSPPRVTQGLNQGFLSWYLEKKRWLDAGQLARAVGRPTPDQDFCRPQPLCCYRPAPGSGVCICPVQAKGNKAFHTPPGQWAGKSRDLENGPGHQPKTRSQLLCPVWPTSGVGREGNNKKCRFLVLVCRSENSHYLGYFWLYIGSKQFWLLKPNCNKDSPLMTTFSGSPFFFFQRRLYFFNSSNCKARS